MAPNIPRRPYPSLKAWRDAHEYTQAEAAQRLGISQAYLSRLERGQAPHSQLAIRLMAQTGVPLETLLGMAS